MHSPLGEIPTHSKQNLVRIGTALSAGILAVTAGCTAETSMGTVQPSESYPTPIVTVDATPQKSWTQIQKEELRLINQARKRAEILLTFTLENGHLKTTTIDSSEYTLACGMYDNGEIVQVPKDSPFNITVFQSNYVGTGTAFNTTTGNTVCTDGTISKYETPKAQDFLKDVLATYRRV